MAALLRHGVAARRLGGSMVQRAQGAVAGERRWLGSRFMHTEQAHEEITRKIQQKKEELYDVISKGQESFWTSSSSNKLLLQRLALQVNPRPEDPKWHRLCFARRANVVLGAAGYLAATGVVAYVVVNGVVYFIRR